jgi:UMF1 family MFS transporter
MTSLAPSRSRADDVPPAGPGERAAFCLFDFANSAFSTIVVTFVYAVYFQNVLVGDSGRGDVLWGHALTVSGIAIAVLSPWLGAAADMRRGRKRRFLIGFSLVAIGCTAALVWPHAPDGASHATPAAIWSALVLFTVANVAFELAFVFYNAFLPELATAGAIGRLSGKAWALGFVGGLACLVLGLGFVGLDDGQGGYLLGPWLPVEEQLHVRSTNLLVAAWFLVFGLPMFVRVRDRGGHAEQDGRTLRDVFQEVLATVRSLPSYPDLLWFLIARLFYNDAVIATVGLAALYMDRTLGMPMGDIMVVAVWLNIAAALGAYGLGFVDDRIGAKTAIHMSLVLLIAGSALAIAVPTVGAFWIASTLVGLGLGPNQSASRSLLARFAPAGRATEYYGLYALSGKATTWLGPLFFSLVVSWTGSQRLGLLPILAMLILGFVLLRGCDEARGQSAAAAG